MGESWLHGIIGNRSCKKGMGLMVGWMRKPSALLFAILLGGACLVLASCSTTPAPADDTPDADMSAPLRVAPSQASPAPEDTAQKTTEPVRTGKDQVTVLVLNGCGIEDAAAEVADQLREAGFSNVATENAMYFNRGFTRVSYRYEEQRAEVDEIASLLEVTGKGNVYNYGDTKDWGREYDILVMVGDPSAAGNPIMAGKPCDG